MATIGLHGDVNNSVPTSSAYPWGRSYGLVGTAGSDFSYRNNYAGEIGGLNQDYLAGGAMIQANPTSPNAAMANSGPMQQYMMNGQTANGQKKAPAPAHWWLTFAIMLILFAFIARRYAPDGEQFAIIKPNLINGLFLTLWIVLILAFLKQIAIRIQHVPVVGTAADLILSV